MTLVHVGAAGGGALLMVKRAGLERSENLAWFIVQVPVASTFGWGHGLTRGDHGQPPW